MHPKNRILFASLASLLIGCDTSPRPSTAPEHETQSPRALVSVVTCSGDVNGLECDASRSSAPAFDRVLGGQNTYVRLTATSNSFNATTLQLSSVVSVRNLTDEPLGTTDGETLDPDGVRVFFHALPTNGVTVVNADGSATFTASNQPYFRYAEVIPANAVNDTARTWIFQLPSAGTTFSFQVYVTANQPNEEEPVSIPAHTFSQLANGSIGTHNCAIRTGGATYCWGENAFGQIGDNTIVDRSLPSGVLSSVTFTQMSAGYDYSCALDGSGKGYCWGSDNNANLGNGSPTTAQRLPDDVVMPSGVSFATMYAGRNHTCALTAAGNAYCWGSSSNGQIGDGFFATRNTPVAVAMPSGVTFTSLALGIYHTCGLAGAGTVYCWGYGGEGQLGDGAFASFPTPHLVSSPLGVSFSAISAMFQATCGLATSGVVYCWGSNASGEIGDNTSTRRELPTSVVMPVGVTFTSLTSGDRHGCALSTSSSAYCWGSNSNGQIGDSTLTTRRVPTAVKIPSGVTFASLQGRYLATCAMSTASTPYCWGSNASGLIGNGATGGNVRTPAPVTMP